MRDATITVRVTKNSGPYDYSEIGVLELSITERVHHDLDVARLLRRLATMVHPAVDKPGA